MSERGKTGVERYQNLIPCTSYRRVTNGSYVKDSVLRGEHAASVGNYLPTFPINVVPTASRVKISRLLFFKYYSSIA